MTTTISGKPPIHRRKWAQMTGASALAFVVGLGAGGSAGSQDMLTTTEAQTLVDKAAKQAHEQATEAAQRDALTSPDVLAALEDARKTATSGAQAQVAKLTQQRDQARAQAAAAEAKAVAAAAQAQKAQAEVRSLVDTQPEPEPEAAASGGTDPRFGTCGEANDNGYGPYTRGEDPEYDWYQDRDSDGDVCEY